MDIKDDSEKERLIFVLTDILFSYNRGATILYIWAINLVP